MFFREQANALVLMKEIYRGGRIRSSDDFDYFTAQVFAQVPGLRSVSATDADYQLKYQFPKVSLAHNLKAYPDRYVFAEAARKTRQIAVDENASLSGQLENAHRELVRATRFATLGELSTVIAHEIRNPLTAIVNCIESLQRSMRADAEDASLIDAFVGLGHVAGFSAALGSGIEDAPDGAHVLRDRTGR